VSETIFTTIRIKKKNADFLEENGKKSETYDDVLEKLLPKMKAFKGKKTTANPSIVSTTEEKTQVES